MRFELVRARDSSRRAATCRGRRRCGEVVPRRTGTARPCSSRSPPGSPEAPPALPRPPRGRSAPTLIRNAAVAHPFRAGIAPAPSFRSPLVAKRPAPRNPGTARLCGRCDPQSREVGHMVANPVVSIGLPVFNGENYLACAIESILAQSFTDFELIISDNASTDDGTSDICRTYAARDARVRHVRNPRNIGAAANFNSALAQAAGRYCKWMAHDDVLAPDFLATSLTTLQAQPDAVLCYSAADIIDRHGGLMFTDDSRLPGTERPRPSDRFAEAVINQHMCFPIFALIRAEALRTSRCSRTTTARTARWWRAGAARPLRLRPVALVPEPGPSRALYPGGATAAGERARLVGRASRERRGASSVGPLRRLFPHGEARAFRPGRAPALLSIAGPLARGRLERGPPAGRRHRLDRPPRLRSGPQRQERTVGRRDAPDSDGAAVESQGVRKHDARA